MANLSTNLSGYGNVTAVSVTAEDGVFTDDVTVGDDLTVTDALTAATVNGLAVTSGVLSGSNPANVAWVRLGTFNFAIGSTVPTSVDLPVGTYYYTAGASPQFWLKFSTGATNWQSIVVPGTTNLTTNGIVNSTNAVISHAGLELTEQAAPSATTNRAKLFSQDNGGGKTQLMVLFPSGVAQQIAIEA